MTLDPESEINEREYRYKLVAEQFKEAEYYGRRLREKLLYHMSYTSRLNPVLKMVKKTKFAPLIYLYKCIVTHFVCRRKGHNFMGNGNQRYVNCPRCDALGFTSREYISYGCGMMSVQPAKVGMLYHM